MTIEFELVTETNTYQFEGTIQLDGDMPYVEIEGDILVTDNEDNQSLMSYEDSSADFDVAFNTLHDHDFEDMAGCVQVDLSLTHAENARQIKLEGDTYKSLNPEMFV